MWWGNNKSKLKKCSPQFPLRFNPMANKWEQHKIIERRQKKSDMSRSLSDVGVNV